MPSVSLSAGETEEIYRGDAGDSLFIRTDGSIRFARTRATARAGREIDAGEAAEATLLDDGEAVFVHAQEAATVRYEKQGFSLSLFNRQIIEVENSPDQPQLASDTERISAEGVVEVNADQTTSITNGGTVTTTVRADSGEVWNLAGLLVNVPDGTEDATTDLHSVKVRSETENVEFAFGETDQNVDLDYQSGEWSSAGATKNFRTTLPGMKIDDTEGVEIVYSADGDQSNTRTFRLQFEVTKA